MATLADIDASLAAAQALLAQLVTAENDAATVSPQQPVIDQVAAHVAELTAAIQAAVTNEQARAAAIASSGGVAQDVNPSGPGGLGANVPAPVTVVENATIVAPEPAPVDQPVVDGPPVESGVAPV